MKRKINLTFYSMKNVIKLVFNQEFDKILVQGQITEPTTISKKYY